MSPNISNSKLNFWDIFFLEIVKIISDEANRLNWKMVTRGKPPNNQDCWKKKEKISSSNTVYSSSSARLPPTLKQLLPVGFSSPSPTPTGSRARAAQRKPISGRQLRPALAKQPPGADGERPGPRIRDKVGSQIVEILLFPRTLLPLRLLAEPFPHFGVLPPAARGIVGDVVLECGRGGTCF